MKKDVLFEDLEKELKHLAKTDETASMLIVRLLCQLLDIDPPKKIKI